MKPLSDHVRGLRQNDIRAVTLMINEAGGINLGQGICDLPTPTPIKRGAQAAIEENKSIYSNLFGIERLRQAIFHKARDYNHLPVTSDAEVMVSVGSTGAFVTTIFALLEPGDEVILFEPFYGYHRNLLKLTNATVRYIPTRGPDFTIDFDEVEAAITPRTKAILVNTPSNPSGKVWSRSELEQILALLQKYDLYAITDEIYEYMIYDGRPHLSLGSLPDAYERTITLSGFSKTYNMTGWRLGYAVGPEAIISRMGLLNDLFFICAPTPLQHGVAEAFEMPGTYFDDMLDSYTAKRTLMCETLEACGFGVPWPQGAYYVLADFEPLSRRHPGFDDCVEATRTLIERAGVASVPGHAFYQHPEGGRYRLRFCYAKEMPVLEQACQQLLDAYGQ